jgi:hypothetical protein
LAEQNSYLQLFYQQALYYNQIIDLKKPVDNPYSAGVGYNSATKVGVFSLVYAYGIQQRNPLDLQAGKISLGYINRFSGGSQLLL